MAASHTYETYMPAGFLLSVRGTDARVSTTVLSFLTKRDRLKVNAGSGASGISTIVCWAAMLLFLPPSLKKWPA